MNQLPVHPALRALTTSRRGAFRLTLCAVGVLSVTLATALASPPAPPPSLCVEESASCATVATSEKIKWHPGHYLGIGYFLALPATMTSPNNMTAAIAEIASMPTIKGVLVGFDWGALETTEGTYNFALLDQLLAACQASGKRLVIVVGWAAYSTGSVDYNISQGRFPAYLRDTYNGIYGDKTVNQVDAKIWLTAIMDRYIALHQALARRYDTHPYFEGVATGESYTAMTSPDYSRAAILAQYKRLVTALEAIWVHTNVFVEANGMDGGTPAEQDLFAHMLAHRMVLSGPDIRADSDINHFERIYTGLPTYGGVDYRGQIAHGDECQSPNLGGNHTPTAATLSPSLLLQTIYAKAVTLQSSYIFWERKTYGNSQGGTDNDIFWDTAPSGYVNNHPTIKEFLSQSESAIPVVTTPPRNYSGVDTN